MRRSLFEIASMLGLVGIGMSVFLTILEITIRLVRWTLRLA